MAEEGDPGLGVSARTGSTPLSKKCGHTYIKEKLLLLSPLMGVPSDEPSGGGDGQREARSHEIPRDAGRPASIPVNSEASP